MDPHPSHRFTRPLLPRRRFLSRVARCAAVTALLLVASLGLGTVGYHVFAHLGWLDAELNAAMILTGMGPVDPLPTRGAKVFASAYALFSGVVFLSAMSLTIAPLFHRLLHRFHLADEDFAQRHHPPARPASASAHAQEQ